MPVSSGTHSDNIQQLLVNNYEPKRKFRWILEIPGIPSFVMKSVQRPAVVMTDGVATWVPIELVMYDPISPSSSKAVNEWLVSKDKRKGVLKSLDPLGSVVERWEIEDMELVGVNFGNLDYSSAHPVDITCVIKYSNAILSS